MNYNVLITEAFRRNIKKMKKRHRRIRDDAAGVIRRLENDLPAEIRSPDGAGRYGK